MFNLLNFRVYSGFLISEDSIEPLPRYLEAIRSFPTPRSTTDIRSWFGLVNQVANYAQLRDMMAVFRPRLTLAGSRFLVAAEQRYAAVEGEALAIAWGLENTRYFTQGCNDLVVVTDHKPLTKLFGDRTLDEISNTRLFRLKQRTLPWKFEVA